MDLTHIKDCEEQREGVYTNWIFEQTPPPHFCLKVVCKKRERILGIKPTVIRSYTLVCLLLVRLTFHSLCSWNPCQHSHSISPTSQSTTFPFHSFKRRRSKSRSHKLRAKFYSPRRSKSQSPLRKRSRSRSPRHSSSSRYRSRSRSPKSRRWNTYCTYCSTHKLHAV